MIPFIQYPPGWTKSMVERSIDSRIACEIWKEYETKKFFEKMIFAGMCMTAAGILWQLAGGLSAIEQDKV